MAPLDTGNVMNLRLVDPLGERLGPSPSDFEVVGAYLRAVRDHRGLTLSDLAETTRISKAYLQAIEEADLSVLPSRPFAIGYVRAYAQALGIDGDAAAARFKTETPDFSEPLRNPIGVKHENHKRSPLLIALMGLVVAGVVAWNVTQHNMTHDARTAPLVSLSGAQAAEPKAPQGPISLGAATPPPADQTTPVAYVTPGMDLSDAQGGGTTKVVIAKTPLAPVAPTGYAASTTFEAKGAIYGAPAGAPAIVLQARKAASLVVRGASGAVYFARQLAPGEAYRAPLGAGLTADIADPAAFDLYVNGQAQGLVAASQTPVDTLAARPTV